MTEQVDFYILEDADPHAKLRAACRIIQKAFSQGLKVYAQTAGPAQSEALDRLLWTFSQGSFIPHAIADPEPRPWPDYPVQLGAGPPPAGAEVLINMADGDPGQPRPCRRIIELVGAAAPDKAAGRQRFRAYREQGLEPNTHRL